MKRALAILAVASMFGFAGFAQVSGNWTFTVSLTSAPALDFSSRLSVDYATDAVTFGSLSLFDDTGFTNQYFTMDGALGPSSISSFLDFTPSPAAFNRWATAAKTEFAGATLYGIFDLEDTGSGWLFGVDFQNNVAVRVETYFNLKSSLIGGYYTIDDVMGHWTDYAYSACEGTIIADDALGIQTDSHCFCWSGLDIQLNFPFACVEDVQVNINFDSTNGFDYIKFQLNDITTSIAWLTIDDFDIKFTTQTKSVTVDLDIHISSTCFTPYFEFTKDSSEAWKITGFELYAFKLYYEFSDCLKWTSVTLLNSDNYVLTTSGDVLLKAYASYYCTVDYDELFMVESCAPGCCGGEVGFTVKNWFDMGSSSYLFDWKETDLDVSLPITSQAIVKTGLVMKDTGFDKIKVGLDFSF